MPELTSKCQSLGENLNSLTPGPKLYPGRPCPMRELARGSKFTGRPHLQELSFQRGPSVLWAQSWTRNGWEGMREPLERLCLQAEPLCTSLFGVVFSSVSQRDKPISQASGQPHSRGRPRCGSSPAPVTEQVISIDVVTGWSESPFQ